VRSHLISILILHATAAFSQELSYGLKGGLNFSDVAISHYINPDAESNFKVKAGLHAGVYASALLSKDFSLASELLYSNKGVKAGNRINLNYINLPVLIQYNLSQKSLIEGGPEIGYLFSARSRYGNLSNTWNNKLDVGFDAGVQYLISDKARIRCPLQFRVFQRD
jgi:hypothetical protein